MNTLLIGKPGWGKTTAAATAKPPILLIDVDGKAKEMEILQRLIEKGDLVVRELNNKLITDRLSYRAKNPDKGPQSEPLGYYEILDLLNDYIEEQEDYKHFKTLVLDSLTRTVEHMKRLLNYHRGKGKFGKIKKGSDPDGDMNWPSWGSYLSNLEELFGILTAHIQTDFICCAHEKTETEKDLNDNIIVTGYWPMVDGQMREKLNGYFNEVYYMDIKFDKTKGNEWRFQTQPDKKHPARTSINLQRIVPANLLEIHNAEYKLGYQKGGKA